MIDGQHANHFHFKKGYHLAADHALRFAFDGQRCFLLLGQFLPVALLGEGDVSVGGGAALLAIGPVTDQFVAVFLVA